MFSKPDIVTKLRGLRRLSALLIAALATCLFVLIAGCRQDEAMTDVPSLVTLQAEPTRDRKTPRLMHAVTRETLPLNGEWRFSLDADDLGLTDNWASIEYDDSSWELVTVPHTWNTMPANLEYDGIAWYRHRFEIPSNAGDALLRLRFEAVFYKAQVWLNGRNLGEHEGGYTPFEFDVTGVADPTAENVIAVRVDNLRTTDRIPATLVSVWSFDWWNYGGIVRDVSMEMTSPVYITGQQIRAVPSLVGIDEADQATVTTLVTIENTADEPFTGVLKTEISDETVGPLDITIVDKPISIPAGQGIDVELTGEIPAPKLWHFDHPHLYTLSTSVNSTNGQLVDTHTDTFGVRLIELKDGRFYLNGESMRLVGLTRHVDSPEEGLAETVTMMTSDYDNLKELNMVFSRPVHYPQAEFIMDYCDRNGILLIPEVPAWQLDADQLSDPQMRALEKQQLHEMVVANFNHPSVWAWSIGNEFDSMSPAGHEFVEEMIAFVKTLDPTRPVGFASNRLNEAPSLDATELADFVMMNQYFGSWAGPKDGLGPALDELHEAWPEKAIIISEFGFEPHWNALWGPPSSSLDPDLYYYIPEDVPAGSEEADEQRRMVIFEQMETFRNRPYVIAAIFWTYQDYRTPSGFMMGVVDADRNKRGSWSVLREEFSPVLFDSVTITDPIDGNQQANIVLQARGPLAEDMPAYTLRGYEVNWRLISAEDNRVLSEGVFALPTLKPGAKWADEIAWDVPLEDNFLSVRVVRPTGFSVLERTYDLPG